MISCLACLGLMLSGCPATAWDTVAASNDVSQIRRYLQENPKDPRNDELRLRIATIELEAAKEANTRYAYNTFLERHPQTSMALEARRRLEELDFKQAKAAGTAQALATFLRRHSSGRYADQARQLRAEYHCRQLEHEADPERLARELTRMADLPCRPALEDQLKRLRLEAALSSGQARQLLAFVQIYDQDPLASEARHRLLDMEVDALAEAARFARARQVVQQRSDADQAEELLARVDRAERAWKLAAFDPAAIPPDDPERAFFQRNRRRLAPLARATERLRAPLRAPEDRMVGASDPRLRWLAADGLAMLADEAAADALLGMLNDPFLEVRRRAVIALERTIARLGTVRGQIWLETQLNKLEKTAKSGKLLFRRAVLTILAGHPARAWSLFERLMAESELPDLLAYSQAVSTAIEIGLDKDAARTARAFSVQADRFASQRIQAWRKEGGGINKSTEGWLILRQLYGLSVTWHELLGPFSAGPNGPARVLELSSVLGPWLQRSRRQLAQLDRWLNNEESRWDRAHPDYVRSAAGAGPAAPLPSSQAPAAGDVPLLALAGGPTARPSLVWAACCHPRADTRLAAATWTGAAELAASLFALLPGP